MTSAGIDTGTTSSTLPKAGAVAAIIGSVAYLALSLLHGNPPIDDASKILDHVADRPWWRGVHLANILAVLLWLAAVVAITSTPRVNAGLGRLTRAITICAAAVYAVYFSIHATGLSTVADRWADATTAERGSLVTETNAVLTLLGSAAFTAQALLGLAILLLGLVLRGEGPAWLGWTGVVAGTGWLVGALVINFAIIVPFTVLACCWLIVVGGSRWRASR